MGDGWVRFYITSPDLRQNFEIRWKFSANEWTAIVHPMGAGTRLCSGEMAEPFGQAFARVFGMFDGAHVIEQAASRGD